MKIAFVSTFDPEDHSAWSGTVRSMWLALQNVGFDVHHIGGLVEQPGLICRFKRRIYVRIVKKMYMPERALSVQRRIASQVEAQLQIVRPDIIFSHGTLPIALVKTKIPRVFWTDATFAGMIGFYSEFANLCGETIRDGNRIEQIALQKSRYAVYASEWAAASAASSYRVATDKIKVIPFGANVDSERTPADVEGIISRRGIDSCKLLFVGVDWHRKGGDTALMVARILNERGIKTELAVVGCTPPATVPSFVRCYGFLSKKREEDRRLLDSLYENASFLIVPSRSECYGVVFPEASSFGLPSLSTRCGGIPTAIVNGRNGWTFPGDSSPEDYAEYVIRLFGSRAGYERLCHSSYREYAERLNWKTAGEKIRDLVCSIS